MTISKMHNVAGRPIDLVAVDQGSRTLNKGNCRNAGAKSKWRLILFCGA